MFCPKCGTYINTDGFVAGSNNNGESEKPVSVGAWMGTIILLCIPVVNVIMFLIYLFGGGKNKTRSNLFRAMLLFALIDIVILVVLILCMPVIIETITQWIQENMPQGY